MGGTKRVGGSKITLHIDGPRTSPCMGKIWHQRHGAQDADNPSILILSAHLASWIVPAALGTTVKEKKKRRRRRRRMSVSCF